MLGSLLKWASKQSGFEDAWGSGKWMERIGGKKGREFMDTSWSLASDAFSLDKPLMTEFNESWGGGAWEDRIRPGADGFSGGRWRDRVGADAFDEAWGGGAWQDRTGATAFNEAWGGGAWEDRTGLTEFNKAWGGGAWLRDRLGTSQFDTDDPTPEVTEEDLDNVVDTITGGDGGTDNTDDDNGDDDDKKKEVTLTDPDIDSEELSPMAGDVQMSSYLASRRRQLRNKKGRTDTMLTRGAYLQDTDNRMMLS